MLCVFGTVIFHLEGSIKRSTTNLKIPGRRKKHVQRDKNGNANNVVFYAILAHPSHMQFLLKSQTQKSQIHNSKYLIQNTMSHIGFRTCLIESWYTSMKTKYCFNHLFEVEIL